MSYREKCLNEKEEKCKLCGATDEIVVHHIDGNRENSRLQNLMPVCEGCHNEIHSKSTDRHSDWTDKAENSEAISLSADGVELVEQFRGDRLYDSRHVERALHEVLEEAVEEKYIRVELGQAYLKKLLTDGWIRTRAGEEEVLIEVVD